MGIFDNLRDAIFGAIQDLAQNFADLMTLWATWGIRTQLEILGSDLLPSTGTLITGPLSLLLGANFGLAVMLVRIFVVLAVLITMVAVIRRRRTEFASRTLSSIVLLLLLTVLFPPIYTLIVSGLRDLSLAALSMGASSPDDTTSALVDSVSSVLTPNNIALQLISGLINGAFATVIILELAGMVIGFIVLVMFYPLSVVFRPFGGFGLNQFRLMTAGVVSIPLSLLLIAFFLAFELVLIRGANTFVPFLGGLATLVFSILFGFIIALTPILAFVLAFNKVSETVGSMDAKFQSGVDVATMPDINTRQIGEESNRDKVSYIKQFATELPGAIASGENDAGTEAKELGKQIALQAASKSGNPYIMAAGVAYTGVQLVRKAGGSNNADGGESQ